MTLHKKELKETIILNDKKLEIIKIDKFWLGVFVGFLGTLIGNIWVTYWFRWTDKLYDLDSLIGAIISTVLLLLFVGFIWRKVKIKQKI